MSDKENEIIPRRVILEVKTSRTGEESPESMMQFLTNLSNLRFRHMLIWKKGIPISLEIAVIDQIIHFFVTVPSEFQGFIESQLISQYPKASIIKRNDYLPDLFSDPTTLKFGQLKLDHDPMYPIRTYGDFKDVDPLSSVLSALSKNQEGDRVCIQYLLYPISNDWQRAGKSAASQKTTDSSGTSTPNPYAKVIEEKVTHSGFKTAIRIAVGGMTKARAAHYMVEIASAYSSFNNPSGNSLVLKRPILWQEDRLKAAMLNRSSRFMPTGQILNVAELGTLFHFPTMKLATIPNISWHRVILSDAPENLPVAEGKTDEEKSQINFFGRTEFKNKPTVFGIKTKDRRRHMYVIGKTGTGKSTLIANMAISDLRNRRGFCIIDPHGDLCETVLDYVPSYRVNDVIYLDPSEQNFAFHLNPLEVKDQAQKELVVSGIVAIFNKIFGTSWGPRLEYILRNTLQSVIEMPDATLLMVPEALSNPAFRKRMIPYIKDPVLRSFWENEFEKMTDKLRVEAIAPIQNKVGQFISSTTIRNIIGSPKSTIDLQKVMDEGKIVLMNLSQGKLGEDNAALLGAMFITKFQLAAMGRVYQEEEERRDFYLYVDEFQNFATSSFIKILSEARKYRLNLLLANQYIGQIPEDVRLAIFGNCGTMMTFLVGAGDSPYLAKEYGDRFKEEDILALGNYQGIMKMMIDGMTSSPFLGFTLPLPKSMTQNREKVLKSSKERYMKPVNKSTASPFAVPNPPVPAGNKHVPTTSQPSNEAHKPIENTPGEKIAEKKEEGVKDTTPVQKPAVHQPQTQTSKPQQSTHGTHVKKEHKNHHESKGSSNHGQQENKKLQENQNGGNRPHEQKNEQITQVPAQNNTGTILPPREDFYLKDK